MLMKSDSSFTVQLLIACFPELASGFPAFFLRQHLGLVIRISLSGASESRRLLRLACGSLVHTFLRRGCGGVFRLGLVNSIFEKWQCMLLRASVPSFCSTFSAIARKSSVFFRAPWCSACRCPQSMTSCVPSTSW